MSQLFISYTRKDREFVRRLSADLKLQLPKIRILDEMHSKPFASWAEALVAQIEQADVILAVLSPDYFSSVWSKQELNVALERQLRKHARLIPLLVRPCTPTGLVSKLTWVDFTEDYQNALVKLVWGITGEKPRAVKGEQPGKPAGSFDRAEIDSLRHEVEAAVERLKSPAGDLTVPELVPGRPRRKRLCFVVMPFGDPDLEVVYADFVRPTLADGCGLDCERGDDVFGSKIIMDDILERINAADVIVADLTRKNANVFYEVGICHALSKPVLLLAQTIEDVPFDLRHRRVLLYEYSPRGCKRLETTLRENMSAVLGDL